MNKLPALLTLAVAVSASLPQLALSQQEPTKASPVEFRACSFRDGKTMKDLDKVSATFRQYANKNDFAYSAWTLIPEFHNQADFDVGWLGAWPDGVAFGVSMEKWVTTGQAVAAEFNQVMDCSSRHEMAMSLPINAPEGTPEDGVLMFYPCTLHEGKTIEAAYKAHLRAGIAMKGLGSHALSWMFQPAVGAGNIDFDYYHVVGFTRYADMGATMEMYVNKGGRQAQQKILATVSSCQTPVVFNALSVRARDER